MIHFFLLYKTVIISAKKEKERERKGRFDKNFTEAIFFSLISLKSRLLQFKFPLFLLENEKGKKDETSERQLEHRYKPVSVSAKFHSLVRERGNNFQRVLEEGGICPPTRRRGLNGFLVGAVKRIKTRTDDEGGGPSLPKIRLCIKTLFHPLSKFAAQWYLTHLTCLMRNHESFSRINCFNQYLFFFFFRILICNT